jgi:hypothetical protein
MDKGKLRQFPCVSLRAGITSRQLAFRFLQKKGAGRSLHPLLIPRAGLPLIEVEVRGVRRLHSRLVTRDNEL